jgi:hypothetical protein
MDAVTDAEGHDLGFIEVYRANHVWLDRDVPLSIRVDGVVKGELMPHEHLQVRAQPGFHLVDVESPEGRSKEIEIRVSAGSSAELVCKAWPGAACFNPLLLGRSAHYRLRPAKPGVTPGSG